MENSQVKFRFIPIIRAFSKEEFKEFGRFVKSPYYNSNKKIIALYETLKKYYPELNHSHLTGEKLYKKIYPGKKFKKSEIEKLSYAMRVLAEKFLTVKGLSKEKPISALGLLRELNDRNLSSNFKRKWKETKSILNDGNFLLKILSPQHICLKVNIISSAIRVKMKTWSSITLSKLLTGL
jgi:hypothetical protein